MRSIRVISGEGFSQRFIRIGFSGCSVVKRKGENNDKMTVECEAILLGREAIHGTANASALAALVKNLIKRSDEPRRRYILKCGKEHGVQMIPFQRTDDEGFESDEDLTSLGSSEENNNGVNGSSGISGIMNNNRSGSPTRANNKWPSAAAKKRNSSLLLVSASQLVRSEPPALQNNCGGSSSVSSVGTDSANSSGGSDNDDSETSQRTCSSYDNRGRQNATAAVAAAAKCSSETYHFHEIAFCHTDPNLPRIIVWVVKTKRKTKTSAEIIYGLEAIVFSCRSEEQFRAICRHFQELSRRSKLEKPVLRYRAGTGSSSWAMMTSTTTATSATTTAEPNSHCCASLKRTMLTAAAASSVASGFGADDSKAEEQNAYNLIQRVDTDGVTHIEVSRSTQVLGCETAKYFPPSTTLLSVNSYEQPSSIISINTPESGNILLNSMRRGDGADNNDHDNQIESVICVDGDTSFENNGATPATAPVKPDRKKYYARKNYGKDRAPDPPITVGSVVASEKVVRGQFVRVSVVDQTPYLSSSLSDNPCNGARPLAGNQRLLGSEARPCGNGYLSYSSSAATGWSTSEGQAPRKTHRSQQLPPRQTHARSKSSGPTMAPSSKESSKIRYALYPGDKHHSATGNANNSLPNRFFGKLRELTLGGSGQNKQNGSGAVPSGATFWNNGAGSSSRFRRRNSIGDLTNGQFCQYPPVSCNNTISRSLAQTKNKPLTKSTPNLKSVIKNSRTQRDGSVNVDNAEPKKVTFSAYATVQVVD